MAQGMASGIGVAGSLGLTAATWGMGLGALPLTMGLGMGVDAYAGGFGRGAQQFNRTQNVMDQNFRFFGGQGYAGRGFGTQQTGQINNMMQGMANSDFRTNMNELQGLVQSGAQNGMFVGVQDVKQFSTRFKEMISTLKTVQQELGGSLQEAMEFARQAKSAGVFGQQSIGNFSKVVRESMASTGFSQQQTFDVARQGAAISRQFGGTGAQGAVGAARTSATLGAAMRSGAINENLVAEATGGLTGQEGIQALTTQLMQSNAQYSRTAPGRYAMFAMSNEDATGLDPEALSAMLSGDTSVSDISRRAHRNVNRMGRGRAMNREGLLRGSLLAQGGLSAQIAIMKQRMGGRLEGLDDDTASLVMQRRHGMSRPQAELFQNLMRNQTSILEQETLDRAGSRRAQEQENYLSENSMDAYVKQFGKAAKEGLGINAIEKAGSRFAEGMAQMMQEVTDSFLGISRSKMSRSQNEVLNRMSMGRGTAFDKSFMQTATNLVSGTNRAGVTQAGMDFKSAGAGVLGFLGGGSEGGAQSFSEFFEALGEGGIGAGAAGSRLDALQKAFSGGPSSDAQIKRIAGASGKITESLRKTQGGKSALERIAAAAKAGGVDVTDVLAGMQSGQLGTVEGLQDALQGKTSASLRRRSAAAKGGGGILDDMLTTLGSAFDFTGQTAAMNAAAQENAANADPFQKVFSDLGIGKGNQKGIQSLMQSKAGMEIMQGLSSKDPATRQKAMQQLNRMGSSDSSAAALAQAVAANGGKLSMEQGTLMMGKDAITEMVQAAGTNADERIAMGEAMLKGKKNLTGTEKTLKADLDRLKANKAKFDKGELGADLSGGGLLSTSASASLDVAMGSDEDYAKNIELLAGAASTDEGARDRLMMLRAQRSKVSALRGKGRRGAQQSIETLATDLGIDAHDLSISQGGRSRSIRGLGDLGRILRGGSKEMRGDLIEQMKKQVMMSGGTKETAALLEKLNDADGTALGDEDIKQIMTQVGKDTGLRESKMKKLQDQQAARDPLGSKRNELLERQIALMEANIRETNKDNKEMLRELGLQTRAAKDTAHNTSKGDGLSEGASGN